MADSTRRYQKATILLPKISTSKCPAISNSSNKVGPESMSKREVPVSFIMTAEKRNGDVRKKVSPKVNHALRALWRVREVIEGYVVAQVGGHAYRLFGKMGRKRAFNIKHGIVHNGERNERPPVKAHAAGDWQRLPCKYNDLK